MFPCMEFSQILVFKKIVFDVHFEQYAWSVEHLMIFNHLTNEASIHSTNDFQLTSLLFICKLKLFSMWTLNYSERYRLLTNFSVNVARFYNNSHALLDFCKNSFCCLKSLQNVSNIGGIFVRNVEAKIMATQLFLPLHSSTISFHLLFELSVRWNCSSCTKNCKKVRILPELIRYLSFYT